MAKAGWPRGPLVAYVSAMESLAVLSTYSAGVGRVRSRPASIPQGCPLSTSILALVMSGWANRLLDSCVGSVPRALADDLL
eukprot:662361-Alexandrium_andersonii.AAC.1